MEILRKLIRFNMLPGMSVSLVGCPERDVADLPLLFKSTRVSVQPTAAVHDDDYVVFCISCCDGPTTGTRMAVDQCLGRSIRPIAIVLTKANLVGDDSLRELVKCEELELLCRVLPRDIVLALPLYYDFDPLLAEKLQARISQGVEAVTCPGRGH